MITTLRGNFARSYRPSYGFPCLWLYIRDFCNAKGGTVFFIGEPFTGPAGEK